jgi:hypothetical protein
MVCGGEVLGWSWRLTACFWCLQAVVLSDDESAAMRRAVVAILKQYNTRLKTGDAYDVATLESLAAAIGPASNLDLTYCKEFVEGVTFRDGVSSRDIVMMAVAGGLKRLDPLFAFLLHPRCCLVKLVLSREKKTCRRCVVDAMHRWY